MSSIEKPVWNGTPSQVINLPAFILLGLFFWLVIPVFMMLWKWLVVKNTKYELTTERLKTRYGVLNKQMDEIELYRVRDYRFEQPFFLRIFSLGNVVMQTSDKSHPLVTIRAIPNGEELRERIRTHVEECRARKGVREIDFE
ncbi:MAG: PH domain-containing protein [Gammaproteobacteria bacterium]|nr:PH domain-containing protein [Gammaproteobacteria bacterium]